VITKELVDAYNSENLTAAPSKPAASGAAKPATAPAKPAATPKKP
jgi:hypothetical protein